MHGLWINRLAVLLCSCSLRLKREFDWEEEESAPSLRNQIPVDVMLLGGFIGRACCCLLISFLVGCGSIKTGCGLFSTAKDATVSGSKPLRLTDQFESAVRNNSVAEARELLDRGVSPNIQYADGLYPLHLSVINENYELVELLIINGAEINCRDLFGRTPLLLTVEEDGDSIFRFLVIKGADPDVVSNLGETVWTRLDRWRHSYSGNTLEFHEDEVNRMAQSKYEFLIEQITARARM